MSQKINSVLLILSLLLLLPFSVQATAVNDGTACAGSHTWVEESKPASCTEAGYSRLRCSVCGEIAQSAETPALGHLYENDWYLTKQPTCTEAGVEQRNCHRCQQAETRSTATWGHSWNNGQVTTPPTCTATGVKTYTCGRCQATTTESIPATGHNPVSIPAVAATCTTGGKTEGSRCDSCGAILNVQQDTPALGHIWDNGQVTTAPGCTAAGVKTYTCGRCQATTTESVPATGHKPVSIPAVAATCTAGGKTEGSKCEVCSTILIAQQDTPVLGHSWNSGVITANATCTTEGTKTYTCTRCGATTTESIPATGHKAISLPSAAATCTAVGKTEGSKCEICGTILAAQQDLPALGHQWGDIPAVTNPTCTENGVRIYTCTRCGEKITEAIPATGHKAVPLQGVGPTCTAAGKSTGSKCEVCGTILTAQQDIPALGHQWGNTVVTTKPTCTEKGVGISTCTRCGEKITEAIPAAGHKAVPIEGVGPTCTTAGKSTGSECEVCGTILTFQYTIPALGHSWDEGEVTRKPGALNPGICTYTCTQCGETGEEELPEKARNTGLYNLLPSVVPETLSIQSGGSETMAYTIEEAEPDGTPLHIVQQPVGAAVNRGDTVKLTAKAEGGIPLGSIPGINALVYNYQWYRSTSPEEKNALSGLLHQILWLSGNDAGTLPEEVIDIPLTGSDAMTGELSVTEAGVYYCVITDKAGTSVTSEKAEVKHHLYIADQSDHTTELPATFRVRAAGGTPPYTYMWVRTDENGRHDDRNGIETEADQLWNEYLCIVSDAAGESVESEPVVIYSRLQAQLENSAEKNFELQIGENRDVLVEIQEGYPPYTVQWSKKATEKEPQPAVHEETVRMTDSRKGEVRMTIAEAGDYICTVTDALGNTAVAQSRAKYPALHFVRQPEGGELSQDGGSHSLQASMSDGESPYTFELYDWNSSFVYRDTAVQSENAISFEVDEPGWYYIKVRDANGREAISNTVLVTANEWLKMQEYTQSAKVDTADGTAQLSVTVAGGREPYTYRWEKWKSDYAESHSMYWNHGAFEPMSGEDSSVLNASRGMYQCVVTDASGKEVVTGQIKVTYAGNQPVILQEPQDVTIRNLDNSYPSADLSIDAISGSGSSGDLSFVWMKKTDGGWSRVGSGRNLYLRENADTTVNSQISGIYRCTVYDTRDMSSAESREVTVIRELECTRAERSGPSGMDPDKAEWKGKQTCEWMEFEFTGGVAPYTVEVECRKIAANVTLDQAHNYVFDGFYEAKAGEVPSGKLTVRQHAGLVTVSLRDVEIWEERYLSIGSAGAESYMTDYWFVSPEADEHNFYAYYVTVTDAMGQKCKGAINCGEETNVFNSNAR